MLPRRHCRCRSGRLSHILAAFALGWLLIPRGAPAAAHQAQAAAGGIHAGPPPAGTMFLYPERIALADGGFATAERGVLFVSANREVPDSGILAIEIYRFRALSAEAAAAPPIFRLFGGPSFQGLEDRLKEPGWYEHEVLPFLEAADFVVVGQRGIGSSKPTTLCERPEPVSLDAGREARATAQQKAAERCRDYWVAHGLDLAGLNVLQAAADVDEVRRALGYDDIQLWGGSFGSHWAMTFMRAYPRTVRRAVLRGMEGVNQTYDDPSGVLEAIEGIAAAADTAQSLRDLVPAGGFLRALKDVIASVEAEPATVLVVTDGDTVGVIVDGDAVRAVATSGGVSGWPSQVLAMHEGDLSAAGRAKLRRYRRPGYPTASFFMLDCGSGISPERAARLYADTAMAVIGDPNWSYRVNCPIWKSDLGSEFRTNFRTSIPTVIVHGDWDTSTPLGNALELIPYFENSRFVLVRGGSHGALIQAMRADPSFQREIIEFFGTGSMEGIPAEVVLPPVNWVVSSSADAP